MPAPLRAGMGFGEQRAAIAQLARSRTAPARLAERGRIMLLSRQGDSVWGRRQRHQRARAAGIARPPMAARTWRTDHSF